MDIGGRIRAAREELGITQATLADAVGVPREAISRMESGERAVKVGELASLARELVRPVSYFLTDAAPARLAVGAYRATKADYGSKRAELWLRLRLGDFVHLCREMGLQQDLPSIAVTGGSIAAAQSAARVVRELARIGSAPVLDLRGLVESVFNVPVFGRQIEASSGLSGMILFDGETGLAVMLIRADEYDARRRFTLGHELGHYLWRRARGELSPSVLVSSGDCLAGSEEEERFANAFAAELIAPEEGVCAYMAEAALDVADPEHLMRIATHFGVSFQATTYRLQSIGLLDGTVAERLRAETRPTQLSGFRDAPGLFAPQSGLFHSLVVRAYAADSLDAGRCAEMLELTTAEFVDMVDDTNHDSLSSTWLTSAS